jgi:BlaI family penicillinase repressor
MSEFEPGSEPASAPDLHLSRRERQVMDFVWRSGPVTAADIQAGLPDPPSYSAVRALLAVLVEKGHLQSVADGRRYVYQATVPRDDVRQHALGRVLSTFFDNSPEALLATLLSPRERKLQPEEVARLRQLLDEHGTPRKARK